MWQGCWSIVPPKENFDRTSAYLSGYRTEPSLSLAMLDIHLLFFWEIKVPLLQIHCDTQKNDGVSYQDLYILKRPLSEDYIAMDEGRAVTSLVKGKFLSSAGQSLRLEWST